MSICEISVSNYCKMPCLAKLLELWHPNSEKYLGTEKEILVLLSTFKVQVYFSPMQAYLICLVYLKQEA